MSIKIKYICSKC